MTKILAVDDSTSMRQMVSFTLKSAGFEVDEAADGEEAFNIAKTQSYDVVISDVHMPKMDGISLVKHLRQLPDYKFVPILILTTDASSDMKAEGKSAGATGWIVKPFDPEKLVATVKRVIG
jgi:two-component system chemotaxis response regulator CheY